MHWWFRAFSNYSNKKISNTIFRTASVYLKVNWIFLWADFYFNVFSFWNQIIFKIALRFYFGQMQNIKTFFKAVVNMCRKRVIFGNLMNLKRFFFHAQSCHFIREMMSNKHTSVFMSCVHKLKSPRGLNLIT